MHTNQFNLEAKTTISNSNIGNKRELINKMLPGCSCWWLIQSEKYSHHHHPSCFSFASSLFFPSSSLAWLCCCVERNEETAMSTKNADFECISLEMYRVSFSFFSITKYFCFQILGQK
jgi:hypothetical protein